MNQIKVGYRYFLCIVEIRLLNYKKDAKKKKSLSKDNKFN